MFYNILPFSNLIDLTIFPCIHLIFGITSLLGILELIELQKNFHEVCLANFSSVDNLYLIFLKLVMFYLFFCKMFLHFFISIINFLSLSFYHVAGLCMVGVLILEICFF